MPTQTIYTLGASNITVTGGTTGSLSGETGGNGSNLVGATIRLENNNWETLDIEDGNGNFQDSNNGQTKTDGTDYDGVSYAAGLRVEAEYSVVFEDSAGNEYTFVAVNINETGSPFPSYGTVEGLAFVGGVGGFPPIGEDLTYVSHQEGPSIAYSSLATPPCFTKGSLVRTDAGDVPIETLERGDQVWTLDHGFQSVRWISKTSYPAAALRHKMALRPVLIKKDAFGEGCPERDTMVSQQHRVLVSGWQAALLYGEDEVLVPAKKLLNDHSILLVDAQMDVDYYHLIFDEHEVLMVDGLESESFLPSAEVAEIIPVHADLLAIFDVDRADELNILPARVCVSDRTTNLLDAAL